ncbi:MAG: UbiA family prenyltransferase [Pirellulaceae bacterium]|nr:UbiA family prenyltransferase [Pirellulaceae bacterium]
MSDESTPAVHPPSPLLSWLRLMRLPNVFTALADVTMGFAVSRQSLEPLGAFICIAAASALLYTAGMVLNDVFDVEIDRRERPERPLPSGRIPFPLARAFGWLLLILGVAFAWLAGLAFAREAALPWRSGAVGTVLAVLVVAYNAFLKRTPLGPIGMGACRFANVLLGLSLAQFVLPDSRLGYDTFQWLTAAGIGVYIVGVTWFARQEAESSRAWQLIAAMAVMSAGVAVLGVAGQYAELRLRAEFYWLLLALLILTVLRRSLMAVVDPSPGRVQVAVKHAILSIIWLDAAICAATGPAGYYGFAIALLLVPALLLGRWVYST